MNHLLKPLQAGSLTLHNRLIMPPMATAKSGADGSISQAVLDYYQEKSNGGYFSLIIIEHSFISPEGKASNNQLSVANDDVVESLPSLAEVIQRNGTKAVMQINHAGSATTQEVIGSTPVAPSPVPHPWNGNTPKELTKQEIASIVEAFQNRIRLHLQVIAAVRAAVGDDFPILLRLGSYDYKDGGITIEDSRVAAKEFEKAGINILDISGSFLGYNSPESSAQGYFSPLTEAIKKAVSIPVILTGGITEPQAAEQLLATVKADLIGVGRAVLKNSQWAKQAIETLSNTK
jgi:NADPH2 dehydrogenase